MTAERLVARCAERGLTIATAESCTGGLVAAALTDVAGASAVFERGFVTYSNTAKMDCLSVPGELLDTYGAVSEPVARAMAEGAMTACSVDLTVAVTGVAGPGGGTADKPVGLVHFAARGPNGTRARCERFGPLERRDIRERSVVVAIEMLIEAAG